VSAVLVGVAASFEVSLALPVVLYIFSGVNLAFSGVDVAVKEVCASLGVSEDSVEATVEGVGVSADLGGVSDGFMGASATLGGVPPAEEGLLVLVERCGPLVAEAAFRGVRDTTLTGVTLLTGGSSGFAGDWSVLREVSAFLGASAVCGRLALVDGGVGVSIANLYTTFAGTSFVAFADSTCVALSSTESDSFASTAPNTASATGGLCSATRAADLMGSRRVCESVCSVSGVVDWAGGWAGVGGADTWLLSASSTCAGVGLLSAASSRTGMAVPLVA